MLIHRHHSRVAPREPEANLESGTKFRRVEHYLLLLACALCLGFVGCKKPEAVSRNGQTDASNAGDENTGIHNTNVENTGVVLDEKELQRRLDRAIDFTFQKRRLNTHEHGAWQILHGVLAYGRDFLIRDGDKEGPLVPAVDYVLNGGQMIGWTMRPGAKLKSGRRGLRAVMEPGTKTGQGHPDQWLAVLAQCGLTPDQEILVGNVRYQLRDIIGQVQHDVPFNHGREWSWTLIGLTCYLPTDASWQASDNETWSIERLVRGELDQKLADSACGGTHRLIGVTMALNQHLASGGELSGVWKDADKAIQANIRKARELQNADGSFSTNYFARGGQSSDVADRLSTTGHILEFLALAMNEQQLREPWVQQAAANLCGLFDRTEKADLECGALYHAMHGVVLYRERMFGRRAFAQPIVNTDQATDVALKPAK